MSVSLVELNALGKTEVIDLILAKLLKHMPCLIRFNRDSQDPSDPTFPGYDDHTGILFGCHYSSGKFEFGIYFKDPLNTQNMDCVQLIERSKRKYDVFAGAAFMMTCYYHWDKKGTLSSTTPYTRTFYIGAEVQMSPNSGTWVRMGTVFSDDVRNQTDMVKVHKFLNGDMDELLPQANPALNAMLDPKRCHPRQFTATTGRRKLMGRGGIGAGKRQPRKNKSTPNDSQQPKKTRKPRQPKQPNQVKQPRKRKHRDLFDELMEDAQRVTVAAAPLLVNVCPEDRNNSSNSNTPPPVTAMFPATNGCDTPPMLACPGCECLLTDPWKGNPSLDCCNRPVCKACADMRFQDWTALCPLDSCMGSWIAGTPCHNYLPSPLVLQSNSKEILLDNPYFNGLNVDEVHETMIPLDDVRSPQIRLGDKDFWNEESSLSEIQKNNTIWNFGDTFDPLIGLMDDVHDPNNPNSLSLPNESDDFLSNSKLNMDLIVPQHIHFSI